MYRTTSPGGAPSTCQGPSTSPSRRLLRVTAPPPRRRCLQPMRVGLGAARAFAAIVRERGGRSLSGVVGPADFAETGRCLLHAARVAEALGIGEEGHGHTSGVCGHSSHFGCSASLTFPFAR